MVRLAYAPFESNAGATKIRFVVAGVGFDRFAPFNVPTTDSQAFLVAVRIMLPLLFQSCA